MTHESFREVCVDDVVDCIAMGPFGSNIKVDCFIGDGIPVLNGSNLTGFTVNDSSLRFVSREKADSLGNAIAARGDVIITHRGTLGQIAYIPMTSKYPEYVISQSQFRLKCGKSILPEYLVFFFHTPLGQWKLLSNKTQTGVPALGRPTSTFRKLTIPLPSLETQRKIVVLINSIQAKIALNARINDYLGELFALKYGEFIDKTEVEYVPLTDVIYFQEGPGIRNWQYVYNGNGVNFINIKCIQDHDFDLSNANQISVDEAYGKYKHFLVAPGDILMSSSGTLGRYAIARPENLPLCMNTSVIRFQPLNDPEAYAYVYGYITSQEFYGHLTSMATGSAQVNFGPTHLKQIEIPLPSEDEIHFFNGSMKPIIDLMTTLRSENKTLVDLRDAMLPKLMSGEIDVSKVESTTRL